MKSIRIIPRSLSGQIVVPPSKSLCHRAIIAAALAKGTSRIENVTLSEDIKATIEGVQALGARVSFENNCLTISGDILESKAPAVLNCRESGSTLRFLIPVALIKERNISFTGSGSLGARPLTPYMQIFQQKEIYCSSSALPFELRGSLTPGDYSLNGDISSQFISGLMFALPLLEGDSHIRIDGALESKSYIDLTIDVLNRFGISIENESYQDFYIRGNQRYTAVGYTVEGDYSQAAFWIAAGLMGDTIHCKNLSLQSKQGDRAFLDILRSAGAKLTMSGDSISVCKSMLQPFTADVSQCPDIAPILAVVAALTPGVSEITGAARLRIKESDRLKAIATELNKLGAEVHEEESSLTIVGKPCIAGGEANSWGDHRIAMALAIASIKCTNPVVIRNSTAVSKSYPDFFKDFVMLGGKIDEWDLG